MSSSPETGGVSAMEGQDIVKVIGGTVPVYCSWRLRTIVNADPTVQATVDAFDITLSISDVPGPQVPTIGNDHREIYQRLVKAADVHLVDPSYPEDPGRSIDVSGDFPTQAALEFFMSCVAALKIRANQSNEQSVSGLLRLILPAGNGYLLRKDILAIKLEGASWVESYKSFRDDSDPIRAFDKRVHSPTSVIELFRLAAGGLWVRQQCTREHAASHQGWHHLEISGEAEVDYHSRLSTPWLLSQPAPRKRLVVVGNSSSQHGWAQLVCQAAKDLNISLVFVTKSDTWLSTKEYRSWCEAVLYSDTWWLIKPEEDAARHVSDLVEEYRALGEPHQRLVDGIMTCRELHQTMVSQVAQMLGLHSQPLEAYAKATDKYALGQFLGRKTFRASTTQGARDIIDQHHLAYPLIFKPTFGLNSDAVTRVDGPGSVSDAVGKVQQTFHQDVLIEKYCSGPEVDVNMVLLDGEVLFAEVSDDFPKPADLVEAGAPLTPGDFQETYLVYPSALPRGEITKLELAVKDTLLNLGFTTGVFHVEARVEGSAMKYGLKDGIVDLVPSGEGDGQDGTPWVLEVNIRPPGIVASQMQRYLYGIEYWGIAMLLAMRDKERAKALSVPFSRGPDHTAVFVFISADFDQDTQEGIFDSDDITLELKQRRPDLASNIRNCACWLKKGQKIAHPSTGKNTFVAYFHVFSYTSRREALEIAGTVKEEVRYSFR
ncbi:hypothetical protein F4780DRAFT_793478 [Xylariomycetidae sp. FL0641]|nr:hypothetical protein F4780DRAFT_793478 [Xylariomycetidae sp. FL0641]